MTDTERFEATARDIILRQWGRIDSCGTLGLLHKLIASALLSAFEDGRKAGEESERAEIARKLGTPEGVHVNMLSGSIAKISMDLCAHAHGGDIAAEWEKFKRQCGTVAEKPA